MPRIKVFILATGAVAVAALAAACSSNSGTTASATTSPPAASASAVPTGAKGAASACLVAHGLPKGTLTTLLAESGSATVPTAPAAASSQTLQAAGIACQSSLTANTASILSKLDTCVAAHGVSTANTGSSLADILLLDQSDTTVHDAMSTCMAQQGISG